jgi:hypothetical protein
MGAPKKVLPPALAANRWRPGQSGNPLGHSGAYGEAMKIARSYAPAAMHRLAELAELNQLDSEGNLVSLSDLPDADRRVIAVAANSILDRAFGKPKAAEGEKDDMDAQLASMSRKERLALMNDLLADLERLSRLRQSLGPRGREARKLSVLEGQVGEG